MYFGDSHRCASLRMHQLVPNELRIGAHAMPFEERYSDEIILIMKDGVFHRR